MSHITLENAYIFRITHLLNLPWLLANGFHCASSLIRDPHFHEIGNPDLIGKRSIRQVPIPPHGVLSDYIPFYFTHHSPMLLNIKTGYHGVTPRRMEDIIVLVSSLHRVAELQVPFVFTDRHAYLKTARFFSRLDDLGAIDWAILRARDFRRDPNDPGKIERYQAEALVHRHIPVSTVLGVACYNAEAEAQAQGFLDAAGTSLPTKVMSDWYF